jgi:predicted DsbA family dithiol-disulfide isomerase
VVHPFHLGRPEIALATEAAWCAADQNKYFEYQRALYENFGVAYNPNILNDIAAAVGLDQTAFAQCLSTRMHRTDVENARQTAVRQGVDSTPTFFINNRRVEGNQPYGTFQSILNQELSVAR